MITVKAVNVTSCMSNVNILRRFDVECNIACFTINNVLQYIPGFRLILSEFQTKGAL